MFLREVAVFISGGRQYLALILPPLKKFTLSYVLCGEL